MAKYYFLRTFSIFNIYLFCVDGEGDGDNAAGKKKKKKKKKKGRRCWLNIDHYSICLP